MPNYLCGNQKSSKHIEHLAAHAIGRSNPDHQISDAQQWDEHEQRFGRFFILSRFGRVR